ncbi:MAG: non-canonical purine NTP pyrophosphatase [DPANN group archaeon]|nr:non-canonical purine NTP pyrophosphatase [DPANN group archaeon]
MRHQKHPLMEITLITSNRNKAREFKLILRDFAKIITFAMEYPELRSDDPREIVALAAKQLAEKMQRPVMVEDSGLFIRALNGFPGTCTKYVFERIGNKGILKVMSGKKDRTCYYKSAIAYCAPGEQPKTVIGIEEGRLATKETGTKGWGQDPIFIPKGKRKTYGESRKKDSVNLFRKSGLEKIRQLLEKEVVS